MRTALLTVAITLATGASVSFAQPQQKPNTFWQSVQKTCDSTAAKGPNDRGKDIARRARDEHYRFGGHQVDSDGRLFRFGVVEAEHEEHDQEDRKAMLGHLGWWQVLKYWRSLLGNTQDVADSLEVQGFRGASTMRIESSGATKTLTESDETPAIEAKVAEMLKIADGRSEPMKEVLRQAILRAMIMDNAWSAAFISYIMKQAGANADGGFRLSDAHYKYIYDAFTTSFAESNDKADTHIYRACPIYGTRPRLGDLVCYHRNRATANLDDAKVRDLILSEATSSSASPSVKRTHCDIVVHVDEKAAKVYVVGGNVQQSVTVKKLRLNGKDLKFSRSQSGMQIGDKIGCGDWSLPKASNGAPVAPTFDDKCSLNDKKWFVLLQMRQDKP